MLIVDKGKIPVPFPAVGYADIYVCRQLVKFLAYIVPPTHAVTVASLCH
jgi:hypothetical protein